MGVSARAAGTTIGLISDTHGLLRPEAVRALSGVERIIHAGDIGSAEILQALRDIAPVDAVRGNNDKGHWVAKIPLALALEFHGASIHVLHDVKELDVDPKAAGFDVVVSGHSHKPLITDRDGVQFVNPGSLCGRAILRGDKNRAENSNQEGTSPQLLRDRDTK